ncbi:DUF1484 family protein [Cupriavidus consociatus]|uniref:DUF1484 family protein n=1 Tax=Cupriavidus consociatus TaxID=2821357 RepID=UPI001FD777AB|nr:MULTISPECIES: DUF1484 family protein [unclassified Cupriavidus]MDK2658674.1 DUF1484 family protein [Cupriavidus sp. LEh21]
MRVSAGLQSALTLLDLQSDSIPECIGLHALAFAAQATADRKRRPPAGTCLTKGRPAPRGPESKTARANWPRAVLILAQ